MSKQGSWIKILTVDLPRISPAVPSTPAIKTTIGSTSILLFTGAVAVILPLLPYEHDGKNRVPEVIFKGQPSTFHAFIVAVMFAFSGAFSALFVHNKPRISTLCRVYSTVAMVAAVALLLAASFSQSP